MFGKTVNNKFTFVFTKKLKKYLFGDIVKLFQLQTITMCTKNQTYKNILIELEHILPRYMFIPNDEFIEKIKKIKDIEIVGEIKLGPGHGIASVNIKNPSGETVSVLHYYGPHIIVSDGDNTYHYRNGKEIEKEDYGDQ